MLTYQMETVDTQHILETLNLDRTWMNEARQRQARFWRREKLEHCPIGVSAPLTKAQQAWPNPNQAEAFHSPQAMLFQQLRAVAGVINARSDAVPSMRANLGTGICLATLGLKQKVFADKMPWLQEHLSLEQAKALKPEDIRIQGDFARGLEMIRFFREVLEDAVPVYCMDTQGPFDLAHLILGDQIFLLMYDDPGLLHHVLEFALELGIKTHEWMKEVIGEPLTEHHHSNGLYARNMGIRICEDTSALLREDAIDTFVIPYTRRLAAHFGGAWVHYCGRNDALTRRICECDEIRGINFGHLPENKNPHDLDADMALIEKHGKIYYGGWPREPGESGSAYLKRLHRWAEKGTMLFCGGNAAIGGANGFHDYREVMEYWYSL
ncbi:MAG: hypothetical protein D6820_00865 [Lentisphaerae bacterium]|nr:MAG: hypothetical protein D6820_00865 [Lentisphaerota bacterium]